jgi:hypothetical protein
MASDTELERYLKTRTGQIAKAVHDAIADADIELGFGRSALHSFRKKRRICWVQHASKIEAAAERGGRLVERGGKQVRARVVYQRIEAISVHVTDEDEAATESLVDTFLGYLHALCGPSAIPHSYEWETEKPGESGRTNWTPSIRLDITLRLPVHEPATPTIKVLAQTHVGKFGGEEVC